MVEQPFCKRQTRFDSDPRLQHGCGADVSDYTVPNTNQCPCQWCGMYHGPKCPSVAAIEYHENGQVKRVEFFDATGANGRRDHYVPQIGPAYIRTDGF